MNGCREKVAVTAIDRECEAEIHANGGTITAEELAHSRVFNRKAMAWTRRRAQAWIRREGWDAHAHDDGSIWVVRAAREDAL